MTSRITRVVGAVAATVITAGALSACGSDTPSTPGADGADGPVTVDFWYSASGRPADTLVRLVDEFNAANDDVEINAIFQGNPRDTMAQLTNSVQSGEIPVLIQGGDSFTAFLRDTGLGVNPTDVKGSDGSAFDPDTLVPLLRDFYTLDGQLVSVPVMASQPVVYFNPEMLTAAGIDPVADAPQSVSDLLDMAGQIFEATGTPGITFQLNEWFAELFSASEGIEYCTPDNGRGADPATTFQYTSDIQVEQWTAVQDLLGSGAMFNVGVDGAAAQNTFANSGSAMVLASTGTLGNISDVADFDFGVWPLPVTSGGAAVPGGSSIWILGENASDAQLTAAADFVAFLASAETQSTIFTETGFLPSNKEALASLKAEVDGPKAVMLDQLAGSVSSPAALGCQTGAMADARNFVRTALERIGHGDDVKDALQSAQDQSDAALVRYNERR